MLADALRDLPGMLDRGGPGQPRLSERTCRTRSGRSSSPPASRCSKGRRSCGRSDRCGWRVVGTKGFGGGFEGTHATAFGEPQMKAFVDAHPLARRSSRHMPTGDGRRRPHGPLAALRARPRDPDRGAARDLPVPRAATCSQSWRIGTGGSGAPRARPPGRGTRPDDRRDPRPQRGAGGDPAGLRRVHAGASPVAGRPGAARRRSRQLGPSRTRPARVSGRHACAI